MCGVFFFFFLCCFFFQAEDGIRARLVTGVQTCALPISVTVSCFDPVRREVARLALEKLVSDGRIQPARIEEMVNRATEEIDQTILKAGEQATFDAGVSGLDSELIRLLGQLKYRYSYGENVLQHSIEVSLLSGMLAAEAGANVQVAKVRSEERRVGKECRSRWSPDH